MTNFELALLALNMVQLIIIVILIFKVEKAIPLQLADSILMFAQEQAKLTTTKIDDQLTELANNLLKTIQNKVNADEEKTN
jgi:uncharacterized protein YpmS